MTSKKKTTKKKAPAKKTVTRSYTTTSGVKVTKYSDGTESRSGGSSSSSSKTSQPKSKEEQLSALNKELASLQKQLEEKKIEEAKANKDRSLTIGGEPNPALKSLSVGLAKGANITQKDINSGNIDKLVNDFIEGTIDSMVGSGKTINPGLTDEDIAAIDLKNFLDEAEASLSAEYKSKFLVAKNALIEGLKTVDYDYATSVAGIEREAKETLLTGADELASRGLAFSSNRSKFETDLSGAEQRAKEASGETARRSALKFGTTAEELMGTDYVKKLNLPTVAGTSYDKFTKGGSVVGSLNSDKQYLKETMARQLATDEANRRSYVTRSLNFQ